MLKRQAVRQNYERAIALEPLELQAYANMAVFLSNTQQ